MSRINDQNGSGGVRMVSVDAGSDGQRIDNFLLRELKGVPRSRIYRLLRKGEVRVNRGRVKAETRLRIGDEVRIPPVRMATEDQASELAAPPPLLAHLAGCIVHEDAALLVINKPAGLAVHGGSGIQIGLIEALRQMRPEARFLELVHRLDRDTSGLIMIAKKRSALTALHEALRGDGVEKRYLALVTGEWPAQRKRVEAPLLKNTLRSGERVVRVAADGKAATTLFKVMQRFAGATLVEASPVTGRTHQIRVHAQFAGHPLAGDDKYGNRDADAEFREQGLKRLFLHACRLGIPLEGGRLELEAPLPAELDAFLVTLRAKEG